MSSYFFCFRSFKTCRGILLLSAPLDRLVMTVSSLSIFLIELFYIITSDTNFNKPLLLFLVFHWQATIMGPVSTHLISTHD